MQKTIKIFESIKEIHWQSNNMTVVEADGKKITIAIFKEQLYAFAYKCPHAGGVMAEGFVDSLGNAVCPLHRYKFSLKTGRNSTGEDYLKTYQTEINENGVFIIFEEKRWF
jgi:3-phenylpropionate/trans-cinnamate dioxygenase ferredoxin subunit